MPRSFKLTQLDRIKVVVLVLENSQGDILLTQRKKNKHLAGYWEFPGGKIEPGESAIQALKRESKEELDYECLTFHQVLQIRHDYPTINIELFVFHEISINPNVKAVEDQQMTWVNKSQIKNYQLPEANQPILQYLLNTLR